MRQRSVSSSLLLLLLASVIPLAGTNAHEDLEVRIAELTKRYAETADAEILIRRADLHRRHKDWRLAAGDLDRAAELGAPGDNVRLARAMLLFDNNKDSRVIEELAGLEAVPAQFLRARALARRGEAAKASAAFSRAIASCAQPLPEHFVEHARMLATAQPPQIDKALGVINLGLKRLGPIISLSEEAFHLEQQIDPEAALRRVRDVNRTDTLPNPRWLLREVELLTDLGEDDQASAALAYARAKLEALPARRKAAPAIREIFTRLDSLAELLSGQGTSDLVAD